MFSFIKRIEMLLVTVLFCLVLMPACQSNADSQKAPDFTLLDLNNKTVSLSDFKDKVVMINFFATYCPPCRMEIPDFVKLQDKYQKEGFTVIGITVDDNPTVLLPPFMKRLGMNYPVLQATNRVLRDYRNVYALPRTFILDRKHHIIRDFTGMVTEEEIEPVIKQALGLK